MVQLETWNYKQGINCKVGVPWRILEGSLPPALCFSLCSAFVEAAQAVLGMLCIPGVSMENIQGERARALSPGLVIPRGAGRDPARSLNPVLMQNLGASAQDPCWREDSWRKHHSHRSSSEQNVQGSLGGAGMRNLGRGYEIRGEIPVLQGVWSSSGHQCQIPASITGMGPGSLSCAWQGTAGILIYPQALPWAGPSLLPAASLPSPG